MTYKIGSLFDGSGGFPLAATMCGWIECERCPGKDLCNHKDGKANGLVKWLEAMEQK